MTVDDNKRPFCVRLVWIISRKNKKEHEENKMYLF